MGAETGVAWTDHTFNPWWGCVKVSEGCRNCYAETFSKRIGLELWGETKERRLFGDKHWADPLRWERGAQAAGKRARVFCASMADWLEDRRELDAERERLARMIEATPSLDWQLLTKRPENALRLAPWGRGRWPENVWAGTTVEHDATRVRLEHLIGIDARVRFVSAEPLVGDLDIVSWLHRLHWVIVGGESGAGHREMSLAAAERVVRDVHDVGCAVFVKQDSGPRPDMRGRIPDAWFIREFPREALQAVSRA